MINELLTIDQQVIQMIEKINQAVNISWRSKEIELSVVEEQYKLFYSNEGYVLLLITQDEAEIINIAVDPKYFGKGKAQQLWEYTVDYFNEKNIQYCYLEVRESNSRARLFYEKNKFYKIGMRKNYYHNPKEHAILYKWEKNNEK